MSAPIRILLADDHTLLRETLRDTLDLEADLEVVGEASTGTATVELGGRLRPDVVLLDLSMPGPSPEATVRELNRLVPGIRIVVLTMHDDAQLIDALLRAGAVGYLHKGVSRQVLVSVIRSSATGDGAVLVSRPVGTGRPAPEPLLTARECEVLECAARAMSNRQIGRALSITEGTVKRHLRNIFTKLEATSRLDAVNKAHQASLIRR